MTEFPPAPPSSPTIGWTQPEPQAPKPSHKKRNIVIGTVAAIIALGTIGALASPNGQPGFADGVAGIPPTSAPTSRPTAVPTAAPTAVPTAAPTPKPTVRPTVTPIVTPAPASADPITLDEITAALATEDCWVIFSVIPDERISVTTDMDVLNAGIDAVSRCSTGEYVEPTPDAPDLTSAQENAVESAQDYIDFMAFSREGLIGQLKYEGFTKAVATFAVDYIDVNWKEQAYLSGKAYLNSSSFSLKSLNSQLQYEGFTKAQAKYGATKAYNE